MTPNVKAPRPGQAVGAPETQSKEPREGYVHFHANRDAAQALAAALQPITSRVRTDVSAVKVDGTPRWTREPLTEARLQEHVSGGVARGVCQIKEGENTTQVAVLDLDSHRGTTAWSEMQAAAAAVRDALMLWGLPPVAFRSSGGHGIHLYVLWDAPQDAYSVRMALAEVLAFAGFSNGTAGVSNGQIEIFPKQDHVAVGRLGNQVFLPLAGHSVPLDADLAPLPREAIIWIDWPTSAPVLVLERPVRPPVAPAATADPIEMVRSAAMAIPNDETNDMGYDQWWPIVCASHEATSGSTEGYDVCVEFSERNPRFDEAEFRDRIWPYLDHARPDGYTRATLYKRAMESGWQNPRKAALASPDGFCDVVVRAPAGAPLPLPPFVRKKDGSITAAINNLLLACQRPDVCGARLGYDGFRDALMQAAPGSDQWVPFEDEDYTRLRARLERNSFDPIGKEAMRDAVHLVAREHAFDSAILWLEGLRWDGVRRVERFLAVYAGTGDTPYTRAVSLYLWTAQAGRVLHPGVQADMVPILVGAQGAGKTSTIKAMAPDPDFYVEIDLNHADDDQARKMRGKLVAEFGELRGLRTKEIEAVKAFVSRTHENWIPKFKEFATLFARRLVFIGSTNTDQFLADETGNRRWLPVVVETLCDPGAVARDVLQLWAEAAVLFRQHGVMWQDAERLARAEHAAFVEADPWQERISQWLARPVEIGGFDPSDGFTTADVAGRALLLADKDLNRSVETRIGRALLGMGYQRQRVRRGDARPYLYTPGPTASLPSSSGVGP